ncbi:hypothetical protein [Ralstonia sp. NFACC01]|uniref:hypothetical protein n=1 Tax=Ralstonia sp. NFACC01 TaxID=1566294 RepID=UPI0008E00A03|nr:hypothetical protein [Ralstonia sp. NFACC01]SFQ19417.1 hypothetical protein SAMN03159417_04564 [Ralstonia sp. NFACC01]
MRKFISICNRIPTWAYVAFIAAFLAGSIFMDHATNVKDACAYAKQYGLHQDHCSP